ncbi:BAG family molecular chaperone regulator 1 isoform X1 [Syngnathus acus]|uniref:BAG family molecular chaperone regulator 1 isoform X1 n=1 Tax=Syngnathus acus TaxID=161584 RepID=UPI001885E16A|nr:BAG family molecular chaperone regulator 1 isoform X1 [Syngnathus acus]
MNRTTFNVNTQRLRQKRPHLALKLPFSNSSTRETLRDVCIMTDAGRLIKNDSERRTVTKQMFVSLLHCVSPLHKYLIFKETAGVSEFFPSKCSAASIAVFSQMCSLADETVSSIILDTQKPSCCLVTGSIPNVYHFRDSVRAPSVSPLTEANFYVRSSKHEYETKGGWIGVYCYCQFPTPGSTKHSITVTSQEDGKCPTVKDLSDCLNQITGIPPASQKLIFKGKSLKDMEQTLSSFGIKNGCKLMMIGKRNSPEEEAELRKLKDIEKTVEQMAKKLEKVDGELTGLKNGFLAKDLQADALGKLDHRVKIAAEQFMKILEQIDALSIPENFNDCRQKKKGLVKMVQDFLAQCDKMEACISDHLTKIQSKNLALAD